MGIWEIREQSNYKQKKVEESVEEEKGKEEEKKEELVRNNFQCIYIICYEL